MPQTRPSLPRPNHSTKAIEAVASIDATDAKPHAIMTASQTSMNARPAGHHSAKTAPKKVATPFPPFPPRNGDQQCPTTDATAASVAGPGPPSSPAATVGAKPLSA